MNISRLQVEQMLVEDKAFLYYELPEPKPIKHIVLATRSSLLVPTVHLKRLAHRCGRSPWCAFFDLTHRCWKVIQWNNITHVMYKNKVYNYVEG